MSGRRGRGFASAGSCAPALAAVVAACSSSLTLPPAPAPAPTILAVRPDSGFAADLVTVAGTGFDSSPAGNELMFGGGAIATVRSVAHLADHDELGAFVPDGATDGPLTLTTSLGRSAPSQTAFTFLGPGHPRSGSAVSQKRLLHQSAGVAVAAGEVFITSSYLGSVLGPPPLRRDLPSDAGEPEDFAASPDGNHLVVVTDSQVFVLDARTDEAPTPLDLPDFTPQFVRPAACDGQRELLLVGTSPSTGLVATVPLAGTPPAPALSRRRDLPLTQPWGAQTTPEGTRLVLLARRDSDAAYVVALAGGTAEAPAFAQVDLSGIDGRVPDYAIAADDATAWVSLTSGEIGVLDLSADTPAWRRVLPPLAATPPYDLQAVAGPGGTLVLALLRDGWLDAFDEDGPLWLLEVGSLPSAVVPGPDPREVFIVFDGSNDVLSVDPVEGRLVQRLLFDLVLGSWDTLGTQTVVLDRHASPPQILTVAQKYDVVVSLDPDSLDLGAPIPLGPQGGRLRGIDVGPDGTRWVLRESALTRLDASGVEHRVADLAEAPRRLLFTADGTVVVATAHQLGRVGADGVWRPGPSLADVRSIDWLLADGADAVTAVWSLDRAADTYGAGAATWAIASLEPGAAPLATLGSELLQRDYYGALPVRDNFVLFFGGPGAGPVAVTLGAGLTLSSAMHSTVTNTGPFAASPDGRRLLWTDDYWNAQQLEYDAVADDGTTTLVSTAQLQGSIFAGTFSATGERAFVLLGADDTIAVIE